MSFQLDEGDDGTSASDRHHLQPLLGYDWIAGTLYWSLSVPIIDTYSSNGA